MHSRCLINLPLFLCKNIDLTEILVYNQIGMRAVETVKKGIAAPKQAERNAEK